MAFFNDLMGNVKSVFKSDKKEFENIEDKLIVSTGNTPVVLTATTKGDTLDGGVNGTDDTLVSAGANMNTHFAFHKNGGNDTALKFDFGGNKDVNDVVLVDSDYGPYGLVTAKSGAVTIGSESEGSLTLQGNAGQNTFAYKYSGFEGVISADMSENGMNMSFDYTPDFYVGQGNNSSLVFEKKDVIGGTDDDGIFSGFGWNTKYWGESIGTIDARNGYIAAINGDNLTNQVIYASKLVGQEGSPESVGNRTYLSGGFMGDGSKFVNTTNDTLYGSENGNTTFYIGQYLGSDSVMNVVDGDSVVFMDSSFYDITFAGSGDNYVSGKSSNGATMTINSKNKLSDLNNVTIQFSDATFNAKGAKFTDEDFSTAKNDMIFGKGEGYETFYVGKDMGNDVIYNVSSGDKIIMSNTKIEDIKSYGGASNAIAITFDNDNKVGFYCKENLVDLRGVKLQMDDVTYNLVGSNESYNNYYTNSDGIIDMIIGSGEGNSVFYTGKYRGNDYMTNVTTGDRLVFLNTKTTDIISYEAVSDYMVAAYFSNGAMSILTTKDKLSQTKDVILEFSDANLKWNGYGLTQA